MTKTTNSKSKNKVKRFLTKSYYLHKASDQAFLSPRVRLAFNKLKQAFIKALIFHHFALDSNICIETDISSYAISKVFSHPTLNNLGQ